MLKLRAWLLLHFSSATIHKRNILNRDNALSSKFVFAQKTTDFV